MRNIYDRIWASRLTKKKRKIAKEEKNAEEHFKPNIVSFNCIFALMNFQKIDVRKTKPMKQ